MTKEEFKQSVLERVEKCPKCWRKGQSVFNVVDALYGVARAVQFEDKIDCFYNDEMIDSFLDRAYKRVEEDE